MYVLSGAYLVKIPPAIQVSPVQFWVRKIPWRRDRLPTHGPFMGFPGGSDGKESACNSGDLGLIPGLGGSPRGGMAIYSSVLARGVSRTEEPFGLQSMVLQSWTRQRLSTCSVYPGRQWRSTVGQDSRDFTCPEWFRFLQECDESNNPLYKRSSVFAAGVSIYAPCFPLISLVCFPNYVFVCVSFSVVSDSMGRHGL